MLNAESYSVPQRAEQDYAAAIGSPGNPQCVWLGEISFQEGRRIQRELIVKRQQDQIGDTILFCEHPPTLSLGWRTDEAEYAAGLDELLSLGVAVVRTDRGGKATYHGPGQLVIYPVVKLRHGIKNFVAFVLTEMASSIRSEFELSVHPCTAVTGLWIEETDGAQLRRKLGAVGLKINRGVTEHGFSVNSSIDLKPFEKFAPCGLRDLTATSLTKELDKTISPLYLANLFADRFRDSWAAQRDFGA